MLLLLLLLLLLFTKLSFTKRGFFNYRLFDVSTGSPFPEICCCWMDYTCKCHHHHHHHHHHHRHPVILLRAVGFVRMNGNKSTTVQICTTLTKKVQKCKPVYMMSVIIFKLRSRFCCDSSCTFERKILRKLKKNTRFSWTHVQVN